MRSNVSRETHGTLDFTSVMTLTMTGKHNDEDLQQLVMTSVLSLVCVCGVLGKTWSMLAERRLSLD